MMQSIGKDAANCQRGLSEQTRSVKYLICFSVIWDVWRLGESVSQIDANNASRVITTNFRSFETLESFGNGSEGFRRSKRLAVYQSTMGLQEFNKL
jgi:hypothetical protein